MATEQVAALQATPTVTHTKSPAASQHLAGNINDAASPAAPGRLIYIFIKSMPVGEKIRVLSSISLKYSP
jgi:hypothetical protein